MGGKIEHRLTTLSMRRLDEIEHDLSGLFAVSEEANPFFSPIMMRPTCEYLLDTHQKVFFEVWQQDELIGVLPLQRENSFGPLPIPHYKSLQWRHGYLATPLIKTGCLDVFITELLSWLDKEQKVGPFLSLNLQHEDGKFVRRLMQSTQSQQRRGSIVNAYQRASQNLRDTDYNAYETSTLSTNRRKNIRTKLRKLEKLGAVTFERLSPDENAGVWLQDYFELEHSGWKGEAGTSILSDPEDVSFWRSMVEQAHKAGVLNFARLRLDGKTIATSIDIARGDKLFALKIAHHLDYEKYSPGVLLEHRNIKAAFEDGKFSFIDSCASPDHAVLNDMMSDRRSIVHVVLARKGIFAQFLLGTYLVLKKVKSSFTA